MKKKTKNISEFKILHDNVLLQEIEKESLAGLANIKTDEQKPEFGVVVSAGPGRLLESGEVIPLGVKSGDVVYFGKYSTVKVRDGGEDYLIIKEDEIMAVQK